MGGRLSRVMPTDAVQGSDHAFCFLQFLVLQDGVHRHVDAYAIQVGIVRQSCNVFQRIDGSSPRTELGRADIDSICSMVYSFYPAFQILGGSQQFDFPLSDHSISLMLYGVS